MKLTLPTETAWMFGSVLGLLAVASVVGFVLSRTVKSDSGAATVKNLNARTKSWWLMVAFFALAMLTRGIGSIVLFAVMSFLALREYVTITPTRRSDHRALFWAFFVILPLQYYFLAIRWYGMFSVFIPVFGFLLVPVRTVLKDDYESFLARTAEIQWGLMVCVYFVSHAPALLMLDIPGYEGRNMSLLFFLVMVVQLSDVLQYLWGKGLGRRKIAPNISPNKTIAGLVGGVLSASLVGMALWWATPFGMFEALGVSLLIASMGFFGDLTMSAIKRDRGVKDYGTLIRGHGGIMDRIDSLCFAAPVFFHYTRYFHTL